MTSNVSQQVLHVVSDAGDDIVKEVKLIKLQRPLTAFVANQTQELLHFGVVKGYSMDFCEPVPVEDVRQPCGQGFLRCLIHL